MKKKTAKKKAQEEKCVIVGNSDVSLADIFDLSDKEWEMVAQECEATENVAKNVSDLARGFGVKNGGTMALRGYFFGRAIGNIEMRKSVEEGLMKMLFKMKGGDDDGD